MQLRDRGADGVQLLLFGEVDLVVLVLTGKRPVGRDDDHVQVVDLAELLRLGIRGPRHAGELAVHAEVVLEGDCCEGAVPLRDLDPFLCLDGLVQPLGVPAAVQDAARELVHDLDFPVLHDVVDVPRVQLVGAHGLGEIVDELEVLVDEQRAADQAPLLEQLLDVVHALVGEGDPLVLFLQLVVPGRLRVPLGVCAGQRILFAFHQLLDKLVDLRELECVILRHAGDDERRSRLVDEDVVDLVYDGVRVPPLHLLRGAPAHVVPQVVEPELVVRAVGDVLCVGVLSQRVVHLAEDDPHAHSEDLEDRSHPPGVALGEIVVHRDHVHAFAGEAVEVGGRDAGQSLPLTGFHLRDPSLVEDHGSHELHVEDALAENPPRGLPDQRVCLRQDAVQRLPVSNPPTELLGLAGEVRLSVGHHLRLPGVDFLHDRHELFQVTLVL